MKKGIFILLLLFISIQTFSKSTVKYALSRDNVKIAYIEEGKGETAILFVHGWCCNKSYWKEQISHFSKKYHVVAVDLAGHGESGKERKDFTIASFAEDVKAVIEKLKLKKVILVGHSMGGYVIAQTASIMPDKILMIVGADTFQNMADILTPEQAEGYLKPFRENFEANTVSFVKTMFPPSADKNLVEKIAADMSKGYAPMGISAMKDMLYMDGKIWKGKIKCPFKSINSDIFPTDVEINKKHYPEFEVKLMKGLGHFVQIENPSMFNTLLEECIAELKK